MLCDIAQNENIQLTLPINATYVSAARLTASSIAYRMGFGIDEVEDVKVSVSEALAYIIKKSPYNAKNHCVITFILSGDVLQTEIKLKETLKIVIDKEDLTLKMLSALVDVLEFDIKDDILSALSMKKFKKENSLLEV